ncbi:MAG: class I SAM-dependent methyltransferase [Bacillota bacterium]|nr:class I SAM-dependent methyltransferase [Bacillota bacterium]
MDIKKDVKNQFGKSATDYVESKIHKEGKDLQKLFKLAELTGTEEVLDVATGGGHTANKFAPFVKKVVAVDLTPEMLAAAKSFIKGNGNKNVEFIEGDAENLPFSDDSFNIVTCRIAPHHFPNVKQFINEVHRVLHSEGTFLLVDNVAPEKNEHDHFYNKIEKKRDYSHFRAWKKTEWIAMLELAGFELQELHTFEKRFAFDSWCERMKLSPSEKMDLSNFFLATTEETKKKFRIITEEEKVISFTGESIIVKAKKV